jgi:hypothetical protein
VSKRKNRRERASHRPTAAEARPTQARLVESPPAESRLTEAATVGWMLSTLLTLASELALAAFAVWRWLAPDNQLPAVLTELFGLCAVVGGAVSLLLAAVVLRSRRAPPPRVVTIVALLVGALPLLLVGLHFWH